MRLRCLSAQRLRTVQGGAEQRHGIVGTDDHHLGLRVSVLTAQIQHFFLDGRVGEGVGGNPWSTPHTSKAAPQSERADWDLQILLPQPHGLPIHNQHRPHREGSQWTQCCFSEYWFGCMHVLSKHSQT